MSDTHPQEAAHPEGMIQITIPTNLGRIEVRGEGDDNPLVKEACEWIVEHGQVATDKGGLSEGAYLEMCKLSKAKYVGVCPKRHAKSLEVLGETVVRMSETARAHSDLQDRHIELQKTHGALQNRHSELQDNLIESIDENKQHILLESKHLNANIARLNLLNACMKELQRIDAWTDALEELSDRDTEAQNAVENDATTPVEKAAPVEPRRSKRKRGESPEKDA